MYTSNTKTGTTLTIYRDESDPANVGIAYRCGDDSGPIDDLDDLLAVLREYQPDDLDDLPTFGGNNPHDDGALSWDVDRLLVNTWLSGFEIMNRWDR